MSVKWHGLIAILASASCTTLPEERPAPASSHEEAASGQRAWAASCKSFDDWDKPGPPFRVYGDTYYVGTCGITALLVVGPRGHTLIDSGTDNGADVVLANIRTLGFDPKDVSTLLISHEHVDHVGGMAKLQEATGATIIATPAAAAVLQSGLTAADDPQAGSGHPPFPRVTGKIVTLGRAVPQVYGGRDFQPILTPGHTVGAMSWRWQECVAGVCKSIVYIDSLNPISADGYRFSDHPALVAAFREGIARVAAADRDIVLAPHPGAVSLRERLLGTSPLIDRDGCRAYAVNASARLDKRLASEVAGG